MISFFNGANNIIIIFIIIISIITIIIIITTINIITSSSRLSLWLKNFTMTWAPQGPAPHYHQHYHIIITIAIMVEEPYRGLSSWLKSLTGVLAPQQLAPEESFPARKKMPRNGKHNSFFTTILLIRPYFLIYPHLHSYVFIS